MKYLLTKSVPSSLPVVVERTPRSALLLSLLLGTEARMLDAPMTAPLTVLLMVSELSEVKLCRY